MQNLRFYLSPYFIAKYYILKDIKSTLDSYSFLGSLLDIGCGEKPYKSLFKNITEYIGIDFKNYSINKDFTGGVPEAFFADDYLDTFVLPYKDQSFDNVVAFQVLEHHKNPTKMISEAVRILKPGGYILMTVPFLAGIHEEPYDYQRITRYGFNELFSKNNCEIVEIKQQGSVFSTISMLLNEYLNYVAAKSKPHYLFSMLIYLPFILFSYLTLILDTFFRSNNIFFNYLILVKKYD
jgi:SAM-dependent methyltransferase